ncbi:glycosyltransferase family 2 protein [Rothia sp. 11273D007AR]
MEISVVIPCKNGMPHIQNQIKALARQQVNCDWEVIVSDNGSNDGTIDYIQSQQSSYKVPLVLIDASDQPGASYARNKGVLAARGKIIAFCDSDDVVSDNWLQAAQNSMQRVEVAGGPLYALHPSGSHTMPLGRSSIFKGIRGDYSLLSCNLIIQKDTFVRVDGFDWGLPPYGGEDTEIALRLNKIGASFEENPDLKIYFRETVGVKRKVKKVLDANLAEAQIWKRHPERFTAYTHKFWPLIAIKDSLLSMSDLLKRRNFSFALRYFLKSFTIIYFVVSKIDINNPAKFLSDMK